MFAFVSCMIKYTFFENVQMDIALHLLSYLHSNVEELVVLPVYLVNISPNEIKILRTHLYVYSLYLI